jgi:Na+-driven multidrug efflux pump
MLQTCIEDVYCGDISYSNRPQWLHRNHYVGGLLFNTCAFLLPALYSTLSHFWVTSINASLVVTTDAYTYISIIAEVLNKGLPHAAWVTIRNTASRSLAQRLSLTHTLILFQAALGLIVSFILAAGTHKFALMFVPMEVWDASLAYVRIIAFSALSSAIKIAIAATTTALKKPDIPLIISSLKFAANIL